MYYAKDNNEYGISNVFCCLVPPAAKVKFPTDAFFADPERSHDEKIVVVEDKNKATYAYEFHCVRYAEMEDGRREWIDC